MIVATRGGGDVIASNQRSVRRVPIIKVEDIRTLPQGTSLVLLRPAPPIITSMRCWLDRPGGRTCSPRSKRRCGRERLAQRPHLPMNPWKTETTRDLPLGDGLSQNGAQFRRVNLAEVAEVDLVVPARHSQSVGGDELVVHPLEHDGLVIE